MSWICSCTAKISRSVGTSEWSHRSQWCNWKHVCLKSSVRLLCSHHLSIVHDTMTASIVSDVSCLFQDSGWKISNCSIKIPWWKKPLDRSAASMSSGWTPSNCPLPGWMTRASCMLASATIDDPSKCEEVKLLSNLQLFPICYRLLASFVYSYV